MSNIKLPLSGGGGLARNIWHMIYRSRHINSQELLLLALLLVLLAAGITNDLTGLQSSRCNNNYRACVVDSLGLGITCLI